MEKQKDRYQKKTSNKKETNIYSSFYINQFFLKINVYNEKSICVYRKINPQAKLA